jgi:hypothetical protein
MSNISGCTNTFSQNETIMNHHHQDVLVDWTQIKTLYKQQSPRIQNNAHTNMNLQNATLGYGFLFEQKFTIESFPHDSGHTLVSAKYGYPKGSPKYQQLKKKSTTTAPSTVISSAHIQMT